MEVLVRFFCKDLVNLVVIFAHDEHSTIIADDLYSFKLLHKHSYYFDQHVYIVIEYNRLNLLEHILQCNSKYWWNWVEHALLCIRKNRLDMLKLMHKYVNLKELRYCDGVKDVCVDGKLRRVKHTIFMTQAAKHDNLPILKWLHENDFKCCCEATFLAIQHGNLIVLKWLRENNLIADPECRDNMIIMARKHNQWAIRDWIMDIYSS